MSYETPEISNQTKRGIKEFFRNLFDISNDMMSYAELHEMMMENTVIHGSNMWILMLAIFIASIGLNVNSTAVIIGAMLISPLMSGILTMGYSLATSDLSMLKNALGRFATQVVISLIASTIYFTITPLDVATSEMIARTSPTLWDVLIALFGGIAGMIGNTRQKKGNVIPGVAIATALMPPLCTAGYGIATMQLQFIFGAFYLFLINTLFIMLSAALVTKLLRVPLHENIDPQKQKKIRCLITAITVITVIPSILVGALTVWNTINEKNITDYLKNEFVFSDTQMVQNSVDHTTQTITVSLVGATVSNDIITRLEQELPRYGLEHYSLHVTQNKLSETETTDNTDKVTIAIQENTIKELQTQLDEQILKNKQLQEQADKAIANYIDCKTISEKTATVFTKLTNCSCGVMTDTGGEYILLTADAETDLTNDEQNAVRNLLRAESGLDRAIVYLNIQIADIDKVNMQQN